MKRRARDREENATDCPSRGKVRKIGQKRKGETNVKIEKDKGCR